MKGWFVNLMRGLTKEDFREIMAAFSLIAGFIYMYLITFVVIPSEANQRNADIILGMVGSLVFGRVFAYYFDEKSSKKDEKIYPEDKKEDPKTEVKTEVPPVEGS